MGAGRTPVMMSYQSTFLKLSDLEHAVITCKEKGCGARVSVRLGTRRKAPDKCPSCDMPFDASLRSTLVELLNFFIKVDVSGADLEIQVRLEESSKKVA